MILPKTLPSKALLRVPRSRRPIAAITAGGETHYVGDGAVVTTAWINFAPEGYTEDVVATLWG